MGKITGFMEYQRLQEASEAPQKRLKNWREFVLHLNDDQAKQQAARCMDCGIPFCNNGCPVNNIIPDWNDLVYRQDWRRALDVLHSTNNFPEFTGRICPAPCEAACTLNINSDAVGIKSIEHAIIDKGWAEGWVTPQVPARKTGKKVAVVGSGPAGLACSQQLARAGHSVTLFEKSDRIGGLLRYGIPDFKLEKHQIDRRISQMEAEGVEFAPSTYIGNPSDAAADGLTVRTPESLMTEFDAVVMTGGSETPRDLPVPGRELSGVLRHGLPAPAEQGRGRRPPDQPDAGKGQACGGDRRRRHGLRIAWAPATATARPRSPSSSCCRSRPSPRTRA